MEIINVVAIFLSRFYSIMSQLQLTYLHTFTDQTVEEAHEL